MDAAEIRVRAERRMGQMLKEAPSAQGQRTDFLGSGDEVIPTLTDLGISRDLSSRAQAMAEIPEEEFEGGRGEVARWDTGRACAP